MPSSNTAPAIAAALAQRVAAAYGAGTRDYSSIQQPASQPQGNQAAAMFLQALANSHAQSAGMPALPNSGHPYRDASTDRNLMHPIPGSGMSFFDDGHMYETWANAYPSIGDILYGLRRDGVSYTPVRHHRMYSDPTNLAAIQHELGQIDDGTFSVASPDKWRSTRGIPNPPKPFSVG